MHTVSVIIPTWNRAELIEKSIRSVLDQTLPVLEVLVCDDGSTDNTEEIVMSIGDDRIKWLGGARGGRPAIPRNRGIVASKGEWLAFLDSDDEWLPDKLRKQLALAENLGCRAVCSNAHRVIINKGVTDKFLKWESERLTFHDLLSVNKVICSSTLLHKSLFENIYGFPEEENFKVGEDYALWLRVATLTDFAFVSEPLVIYRDDAANSVRCDLVDELMTRVQVFSNFVEWSENWETRKRFVRSAKIQAMKDYVRSKAGHALRPIKKMKRFLLDKYKSG